MELQLTEEKTQIKATMSYKNSNSLLFTVEDIIKEIVIIRDR